MDTKKLIIRYSDFITENNTFEGNNFSYIDEENKEIRVNTNKLKELFSFVGEGIYDISVETKVGGGNIGKEMIQYNSNFVYMVFNEDASGSINMETWKKVESILDPLKGNDGFDDYTINSSHNQLILEFDQKYPLGY